MKPTLESRRARVRRVAAKRPAVTIEVTYRPCPAARERLVDLLVELLDQHQRSGGRS